MEPAESPTKVSQSTRDQQFCLRWNNYQTNLTQVFHQLFINESFVDVTLACEGRNVKAHRLILSACSPFFQQMLLDAPCSHPVIILQGVQWNELKSIVEFMYKGEISINSEQLSPLLKVAESLKIRGLTEVDGDEPEAVLTSPSSSPKIASQFWPGEENPHKKRRLSDDIETHITRRSRSRSRSPPSPKQLLMPAADLFEPSVDLIPRSLSRSSSRASSQMPSLPTSSPLSNINPFGHMHGASMGPMPPPGHGLPPHLAHLPPLSPLSPLLNMHPMGRSHHSPEDFEIRPGIAEMIREEERRRREHPDMAKLLESTHHWIANPMADLQDPNGSLYRDTTLAAPANLSEAFDTIQDALFVPKFNSKNKPPGGGFLQNEENPYSKTKGCRQKVPTASKLVHKFHNTSCFRSKSSSKWTQEDLNSALAMVRNGTPIKPAAEKFNIPVMTLWRRTRALGLVSSKVQCGFRYSSVRNASGMDRISSSRSVIEIEREGSEDRFDKERSPLGDSNHRICPSAEDFSGRKSSVERDEKFLLKENTPEIVTSTEILDSKSAMSNYSVSALGSHQKEIFDWLSYIKQSDQSLTHLNEKLQLKLHINSLNSKDYNTEIGK